MDWGECYLNMIQMNASLVLNQAQQQSADKRVDMNGGHKAAIARTVTEEETTAKHEGVEKTKVINQSEEVQAIARDEEESTDDRQRRGKNGQPDQRSQAPEDEVRGITIDLNI